MSHQAIHQDGLTRLSGKKAQLLQLLLEQNAHRTARITRRPPSSGASPVRVATSGAQRRLWFIDQLEGGSQAYHLPLRVRIVGKLDHGLLQAALDVVVARHEVLRTGIVRVEGQPLQEIRPPASFALTCHDLSALGVAERETELARVGADDLRAAFDLSCDPLIRGHLFELTPGEHVLQITLHHVICDGWSLEVLLRDVAAAYEALRAGQPGGLPPLPIQYADFAHWQQHWLQGAAAHEQLSYWQQQLSGAPALLEIPTDRARPPRQTHRGASLPITLAQTLSAQVRALAKNSGLTAAMILHTAWAVTLGKLSGQDDIVLGMPVAGRGRSELEPLIGFFVNTLATRLRLAGNPTVTELLQRARESLLGAYAHQDIPFEHVVEVLQPVRSLSHSAIFQATFAMQTARQTVQAGELTFVEEEVPLQTAQYDLTLWLRDSPTDFAGVLNYACDLFDAQTIERWAHCFEVVLSAMVQDPARRISELPMLTPQDQQQVLRQFNPPQSPYPSERLIHEIFEEQVKRQPDALAVCFEGQSLTYATLDCRANQLARYLRHQQVGPDVRVGLCVERGVDMMIAIVGILKAGGAYVPLDPSYPVERLKYMLEDAAPRLLLTQERLKALVPCMQSPLTTVSLDGDWPTIAAYSDADLDLHGVGLRSHHLAYVIYTSGSTGRPKGVMIEHRNVLNLWTGLEQLYRKASVGQRIALNASFNFDASVQQWVALLSGKSLFPVPQQERRDAPALFEFLNALQISGIDCTPSQLKTWLAAGLLDHDAGALRMVLVGGEAIDPDLWKRLANRTGTAFFNVYGPTECTVDSTVAELTPDVSPHIGRPMQNRRVTILDQGGKLLPPGVIGELYIGGAGIGRGYLNQPGLTAERFVPDTFNSDPLARLYKTGDLARWRADGTIEYVGRNDHQVKIRGFRIELGEIEAQILQQGFAAAAVLAREDSPGDPRLVAYVVPSEDRAISGEELRTSLKLILPDYMVPSAVVVLDSLPLTPSGKLDRRALPAPDINAFKSGEYEPPQGELEELLAGIWQSLLGIEGVGRHDNFFELGGHSLLIVQMMDRLGRVGRSVAIRRVFESPTLADLAAALGLEATNPIQVPPNGIPAKCDSITPDMLTLVSLERGQLQQIVSSVPGGAANIQDIYPLVPLQEGMVFHSLLDGHHGDTYVLPLLFSFSSRQVLNGFVAALQATIDRHDVLRTAILAEGLPRPVQIVYRTATLPVEEFVLEAHRDVRVQLDERMKPGRQRLDLSRAPLLRLQVAAQPHASGWFGVLQLHHTISDHVTLDLMMAELLAHMEGRANELPEPVAYRAHVARALAHARNHDTSAFFRKKLEGIEEPTAPLGLVDTRSADAAIEEAYADVEPALAKRIRTQVRRLGVSAATLFHASWALVVARTSARDDVVFGTLLSGRLQAHSTANRAFGLFINTLPLRLSLTGLTVKELLEHTQRELLDLMDHEQASLNVAQRAATIGGTTPLFTALFNYRHSAGHPDLQWPAASGVRLLASQERTNYPVALSVDDTGDGFKLKAQTDPGAYANLLNSCLQTAVGSLVEALESAPDTLALSLEVLPQGELNRVSRAFNATQAAYPCDKLIHELFEEQTERTPEAIAAICASGPLTYRQLNARANQIATWLQSEGVAPGTLVPVVMARSLEMLIVQIAILKSGGAYVPLDPELPEERRKFVIRDCGARVVVVDGASCADLKREPVRYLDYRLGAEKARLLPVANLPACAAPAAYVMYTSGSTGVPKGVVVPHHAVNRLAINNGYADIGAGDCIAHYSNPAFDASTFEIWCALLTGASLVIVPQDVVLDAARFAGLLRRHKVNILYMSVGLFNQYTQAMSEVFCRLRYLLVGGDALEPSTIRHVLRHCPPACLLNVYGPTECTTFATAHHIVSVGEDARSIPIGRPIANGTIYILDAHRRPVPVGVGGEIHIGGAGVANGYLNRPELTAERFLPDHFSSEPGARIYRTGDLGRWRADGTVDYLGRNDLQVKIRGFRIELGEIEAQLMKHPDVKECVVLARQDGPGEKRLVAYVVSREPTRPPSVVELRTALQDALPDHMVPGAFVLIESMPLAPTGKVNRRALPAPDADAYLHQTYAAPATEVELKLAPIMQRLLQVPRVGRFDHFFELGGHSLLALALLSGISETFGVSLPIKQLYRYPTLKELAERIAGCESVDEFVDLEKESQWDPGIVPAKGAPTFAARAILLTGATGFVGRFLLVQLLQDTSAKIYCLVRATSQQQAARRLREALDRWDLWNDEFESRIVALAGDLRSPQLGIDATGWEMLGNEVDAIYHCATSMNHLETYPMAKAANVGSATELLKLATTRRPKVVNFVSTLDVFSPLNADPGRRVNERTPIDQERHRSSSGYAASKWVGEKSFLQAQERGIPCNIFRLGLVWADSEGGCFDERQQVYRVLKTCLVSGYGIKEHEYPLPPTPVNYVARAIVHLATWHAQGGGIFHISAGGHGADRVFERCNETADLGLKLLPFEEWVAEIRRLHELGCSLPAVPLIESFFSMDAVSLRKSMEERRSSAVRIESTQTHRELEGAGIATPVFNNELLGRCLRRMLKDEQAQAARESDDVLTLSGAPVKDSMLRDHSRFHP
jgi:amino acid adenylation domain-containing protein/thioester reductase-like protein